MYISTIKLINFKLDNQHHKHDKIHYPEGLLCPFVVNFQPPLSSPSKHSFPLSLYFCLV